MKDRICRLMLNRVQGVTTAFPFALVAYKVQRHYDLNKLNFLFAIIFINKRKRALAERIITTQQELLINY